jgi:hypothetical protein
MSALMLHTVTYRALALAACGWLLASEAAALTLGRARGAVLVGRPLELSIPVTMDGPDSEGACATADVFYGEQKLTRAPTVRWEPGGGTQGSLRITSALPVDEPMVTVYLKVGCAQTATRRYVLLSELPPDSQVVAPAVRSAPPVVAQALPPAATAPGSQSRSPLRVPRRAPEAAATAPPAAPVLPRARKPVQAVTQPRLRVEPVDLTVDRDPTLRLTSELSTQVATDPRSREAAAAMWAALQKGPEEALQDAVRLQGVERELNSLRNVTKQNADAVVQMRTQVEQARGERNFASLALVVLAAVLAALLGWLGWRWHHANRVARVGRWFEANGQPVAPGAPAAGTEAAAGAGEQAEVAAGAAAAAVAATAAATPPSWSPSQDFQASRGGSVRMVGVDELIDVHDKADFFLSIGEYDQAIAVLEGHVHDQVETSALAWMDLLELYHSLGKRVEYERLRGEFSERFAAQVPDFGHFDQPSASLENYSRALSRIVALWPARRVLDVIEESIFRKPGLPGSEPFSLEAYRELVLLYHVAREVAPPEQRRDARTSGFTETSMQPLNMLEGMEEAGQDSLLVPPSSARVGVDIDLSEGEELPALDFDMSDYDALPEEGSGKRR